MAPVFGAAAFAVHVHVVVVVATRVQHVAAVGVAGPRAQQLAAAAPGAQACVCVNRTLCELASTQLPKQDCLSGAKCTVRNLSFTSSVLQHMRLKCSKHASSGRYAERQQGRPCVRRAKVALVGREFASPTTGGFCRTAAAVPTGCWPCNPNVLRDRTECQMRAAQHASNPCSCRQSYCAKSS